MQKPLQKNTTTTPVLGLNSKSMTGWSMVADGSTLDCVVTREKNEEDGFSVDLEPPSELPKRCVLYRSDKLRCWFDQVLGVFLKEVCAQDSLRPLPPMVGNGQSVDLLRLFWVVRKRGGFGALSKIGVWDLVAKECGLGLTLGWAVKLVYVKYLHLLERVVGNKELKWSLGSSGIDFEEHLMDLQGEFTEFFSEVSDRKLKEGGYPPVELSLKSFKDSNEVGSAVENSGRIKDSVRRGFQDLDLNITSTNNMGDVGKLGENDEVKSEVGDSGRGKKNDGCDDVMIIDPSTVEEVSSVRKRKRERSCGSEAGDSRRGKKNDRSNEDIIILDPSIAEESTSFSKRKQESIIGMLNWVRMIATDPCDPVVGLLPERSKWKSFGSEENWMQVLDARETIFLKRHADSSAEQANWQKNQRMHPSMYDDHSGSSYNLRERLRLEKKRLSSQSGACSESSSASDLDKRSPGMAGAEDQLLGTGDSSCVYDRYSPSCICLGSDYQAQVPEWSGEASESESKWLGSRIWPLEKPENRYIIERDPIGKGRQESCGCLVQGSIGCVRFHISEKRLRVKRELGGAFYHWEFNQMGEEVGLPWTAEEEKKFKNIVKANPLCLEKTLWDEMFKSFPKKSRRELVSYYFNVFLLQRRGYQNRFTPNHIDSDDEELELGSVTNGFGNEENKKSQKSILKSPRKPQPKCRGT